MIQDIHTLTPEIDFGFGRTAKKEPRGTAVTVWLSSIYNLDAYSFELSAPGTVTKISPYEYTVRHALPGVYSLSMAVTHKPTGLKLVSNTLNLTLT